MLRAAPAHNVKSIETRSLPATNGPRRSECEKYGLADDDWRFNGLPPGVLATGAPFKVEGLVGSVTETRVLHAPQRVLALTFGVTVATRSAGPPMDPAIQLLTMQRVWHRIVER